MKQDAAHNAPEEVRKLAEEALEKVAGGQCPAVSATGIPGLDLTELEKGALCGKDKQPV